MKKRICIIGAGPSGVTTLRSLQTLDESSYEVICYERYDSIGGIWNFRVLLDEDGKINYRGKEGIEEDGLEAHSGMYYNLLINNPKFAIELPEHLFHLNDPNATGKPCYPDRSYLLKYLNDYAEKYELLKNIQFQVWVDKVYYVEEENKFHMTIKDLKTQEVKVVEPFDYVIVATGHFNYPNEVTYPGQDTFPGRIIHSKYFIDAARYKGDRILVVGASYSGEDIAMQTLAAGAKCVTISHRTTPADLAYPEGIEVRPLLEKIDGNTVSFQDGSQRDFDTIIYCTGYLHKFPFMEESLQLRTINRLAMPLYKGIMFPDNDRLFYIGMQNQFYTFSMFWLQGHLCANIISGRHEVPSKEMIMKQIEEEQQAEGQLRDIYEGIDFQSDYVNVLADLTQQERIDGRQRLYKWVQDRLADIKTYKVQTHYKSTFREDK